MKNNCSTTTLGTTKSSGTGLKIAAKRIQVVQKGPNNNRSKVSTSVVAMHRHCNSINMSTDNSRNGSKIIKLKIAGAASQFKNAANFVSNPSERKKATD